MRIGWLYFFDAPLRFIHPAGIMGALLAAFALLGALSIVFAAPRTVRTAAAMAVHATGGILTILAGDLLTLLLGWELLSFSAFFLIGAGGRRTSLHAAWRYLVFQIVAAAILFAGMAIQVIETGSLDVDVMVPDAQPFVLIAVAIKTAAIPLHGWLVNGYPAAPPSCAPLLSVFATKVGVYTAARLLNLSPAAVLGAIMAVGGVAGALGQRTGRRLLSYHIISQVGYMMAGVGLGTELGIQAGIFHAVNNIMYKGLLFMVIGAVILRVGHDNLNQLGGLAARMPWTFAAGLVGSASIAGLPPFNGFASKELLKHAIGSDWIGWLLLLASVGTGLSFLKFMYLVFLCPRAEPVEPPLRDAPPVMRVPMAILAALCLVTGLWPALVARGSTHSFYTASSIMFAILPLFGSVLLWVMFRRALTRYRPIAVGNMMILVREAARSMRSAAVRLHDMRWQHALGISLVAWLAIVLLMSRS